MKKLLIGLIAFVLAAGMLISCEEILDEIGEGKIVSFSFDGISNASVSINDETFEVNVVVPSGTNLTNLTPKIEVSKGAKITPNSGAAQDFSVPITYTVKASDNQIYTWKVYVFAGGGGNLVIVNSAITSATTWIATNTYIIENSVYVDADLVIQPGTWIRFKPGASLVIGSTQNGSLIAEGTSTERIHFTSFAGNATPGNWVGLKFETSNKASVSSLKYCDIELAEVGVRIDNTWLKIDHCLIQNIQYEGIDMSNYNHSSTTTDITANEIKECGDHTIVTNCNSVHLIDANNILISTSKGVEIEGSYNLSSATWKKLSVPYFINDRIQVNGELTLEQGSIFKFSSNGGIIFGESQNTSLFAVGTSTAPITFTSSAISPTAGNWYYLEFREKTQSNTALRYCIIEYAGKEYASLIMEDCTIAMTNCSINHGNNYGIDMAFSALAGKFSEFTNNSITNVSSHPISIYAESIYTLGQNNTITAETGYGILVRDDNSGLSFQNRTWEKQTVPFYLEEGLWVFGTLTIKGGNTFLFNRQDLFFHVGEYSGGRPSTLILQGTSTEPIKFSSAAATPVAGNWSGLLFEGSATACSMNYTTVEYAGYDSYYSGNISIDETTVSINSCTISNSSSYGIYKVYGGTYSGTGNTFSNNASGNEGIYEK